MGVQVLVTVGTVTAKLGIEVRGNIVPAGVVFRFALFYILLMAPVIIEFVGLRISIPWIIESMNFIARL